VVCWERLEREREKGFQWRKRDLPTKTYKVLTHGRQGNTTTLFAWGGKREGGFFRGEKGKLPIFPKRYSLEKLLIGRTAAEHEAPGKFSWGGLVFMFIFEEGGGGTSRRI